MSIAFQNNGVAEYRERGWWMDQSEDGIAYILRRNRELGQVLKTAREYAGLLQKDCAERIGTYRQRYAAIERGEEPVGAAELEVLARYLDIPSFLIWPTDQDAARATATERLLYVPTLPGEALHIIVGEEAPENVPAARYRDLSEEGRRLDNMRYRPLPGSEAQP